MSFDLVTNHLLTWMILVPAIVSLALLATEGFGGVPAVAWRVVGLAASLVELALGGLLFANFDPRRTGFQLVDYAPWLPEYGIHYYVGVDGIGLPLVLLTSLLVPVAMVASWNQIARAPRAFVFFLLVLESSMVGAFASLNLFQFYVYAEVMLVPMYFLVGVWGQTRRREAALRFLVFSMLGSALLLVSSLALAYLGFDQNGVWSFDLVPSPWGETPGLLDVVVATTGPWWQTQFWLFGAFALAFAIRIPLVPFHVASVAAQVEAPPAASVLLAGVLTKVGAYGLLRYALPLFPTAAAEWTPFLLTLCVVGVLYAALLALVQRDLKRLVAYASLAQLGFVVLGVLSMNLQGMNGSVMQMVNHGLSTAALFVLVGMLEERRGTRDLLELGGVARPMPIFACLLVVAALSLIGTPPLNGFVGDFLVLLGVYRVSPVHAVWASVGVVCAGLTMLWMLRSVLLGPIEHGENRKLIDLDWREKTAVLALCIPIVAIGVYPSPLLRRIEPSVSDLLQQIETRRSIVDDASAARPETDLEDLR